MCSAVLKYSYHAELQLHFTTKTQHETTRALQFVCTAILHALSDDIKLTDLSILALECYLTVRELSC